MTIAIDLTRGLLGLWSFAAALEGFMFKLTTPLERALLLGAGVGLFWPSLTINATGLALLVLAALLNRARND